MALYLLHELTDDYATDARIRAAVDSREIWIVPSVNPDGAEFDVATGDYVLWRKNRQPPPAPASAIGTDLNRNWGFQWGCCPAARAAIRRRRPTAGRARSRRPETQAVRDLVAVAPGRRRPADQGRDRLPHLRRARAVAVRLHVRPTPRPASTPTSTPRSSPSGRAWPRPTATRPQQALRPLHHRRRDRRLALGRRGRLRLHLRDVPDDRRAPASIRPTRSSPRRRRATARRSCGCWRSPTARTARSASRRSTAPPPSRRRRHRRRRRRPAGRVGRHPRPRPAAPAPRALASALDLARRRRRRRPRAPAHRLPHDRPARCRGTLTLKARLPGGRGRTTTIARVDLLRRRRPPDAHAAPAPPGPPRAAHARHPRRDRDRSRPARPAAPPTARSRRVVLVRRR